MAVLQAGPKGAFAWLLYAATAHDGTPHEAAYFWLTGVLSAFLDNAPTYLVFFELASGDAKALMGPLSGTLAAISMGAVYMGALTYIGNAPNLMVYAIANEQGVRMPSFFGYFLWAACILVPLFLILTLLPISPIPQTVLTGLRVCQSFFGKGDGHGLQAPVTMGGFGNDRARGISRLFRP